MHTSRSLRSIILLFTVCVLVVGCDGFDTGTPPDAIQDEEGPTVQFASGGKGVVPTDSIVSIGVTLSNSVGSAVSVEVLFAAAASSASPSDIGGFDPNAPTKLVEFPEGAVPEDTQFVEVNVANADLSEGSKVAIFALQQLEPAGTVEIGMPNQFSLNIGAKPIAEARSEGETALVSGRQVTVTIRGTVTRAFGAFVRFQDDSGPTGASGLVIRQTFGDLSEQFQQDVSDGTIQPGTDLLVTGSISQFSGMLQINNEDLGGYTVISQGDPPAPQSVSLADIEAPDGEMFMSELIRVEGLSFPDADTSETFSAGTTYTVMNEGGTSFEFRVQDSDETDLIGRPIPNGVFTYEGVLGQFNVFSGPDVDEGYQFIPVRASDLKQSPE